MKILKKPDNIIFDTKNPNFFEFNPVPKSLPIIRLNEVSLKSDYDFLSENFSPRENILHPIFLNFGSSYFYCLEV